MSEGIRILNRLASGIRWLGDADKTDGIDPGRNRGGLSARVVEGAEAGGKELAILFRVEDDLDGLIFAARGGEADGIETITRIRRQGPVATDLPAALTPPEAKPWDAGQKVARTTIGKKAAGHRYFTQEQGAPLPILEPDNQIVLAGVTLRTREHPFG